MKTPTGREPTAEHKRIADQLADLVIFAQKSVTLNISATLNEGNVSFPQFFILAYLDSLESEEFPTMGDIAKKMGTSTAAATGCVDRMEKLKHLERIHSAEDRRKIMVRITDTGRDFVTKMRQEIRDELAILLTDLESKTQLTIEQTRTALDALKNPQI